MGTVLAFTGSPRPKGHCNLLLAELKNGVESAGGTLKTYDLNHPEFRGCQGCFYCRTHPDCSVNDYLTPAYDEIKAADGLVFTSPIYFAQISGQAKKWVDRMFPMLDGQSFRPRHPGKKVVTIFAQGDGNAERFAQAVNMVHGFIKTFGWELQENLMCSGVSAPGYAIPDDLLQKARQAGQELAASAKK